MLASGVALCCVPAPSDGLFWGTVCRPRQGVLLASGAGSQSPASRLFLAWRTGSGVL